LNADTDFIISSANLTEELEDIPIRNCEAITNEQDGIIQIIENLTTLTTNLLVDKVISLNLFKTIFIQLNQLRVD